MKHFNKKGARLLALVGLLVAGFSAQAQLNGTYTVYGAGANYATLQAAANALSAGVSGPVVFQIRPGTWSDANTVLASIGNVSGSSATNTITFEAENGSAATTILENTSASTTTTNNNIFYLNGARYIRVRNLTLNKTNSTYGTSVRFAGDADYNIIENCIITGNTGTTTSTNKARIYADAAASANNNIIRNNTISTGSNSIYWLGNSTTSLSADNEFSGNTLSEPFNYGINAQYTSNLKVANNTIVRTTNMGNAFYGIYLTYADNAFKIEGNIMSTTGVTTSTHHPLYMQYCDGTTSARGSIKGNKFSVSTSSTGYGSSIYYGNYYDITENVFTVTGTSGTVNVLYNYNVTGSAFDYGKSVYVNKNEFTATTTGTIYLYSHYQNYQRDIQFNENKVTFNGGTGTQYIYSGYSYNYGGTQFNKNIIRMNGTSATQYIYVAQNYLYDGVQFNDNDIEMNTPTTGSGTKYIYVGSAYLYGGFQFNRNRIKIVTLTGGVNIYPAYQYAEGGIEFNDNNIDVSSTTGYIYQYAGYYAYYNTGKYHFNRNKIKMIATGSATLQNFLGYYQPNNTSPTNEAVRNEVTMSTTGSAYNYVLYQVDGGRMDSNICDVRSNSAAYGIYSYGKSGGTFPWSIKNNKIIAIGGSSTVYGLLHQYCNFAEIANNSIYGKGTSTVYNFYPGYPGGGCHVYNNTAHAEGSSTTYGLYCYTTAANQAMKFSNNVFSKGTGSGAAAWFYNPQFITADYNNYYAQSGTAIQGNTGLAGTWNTIAQWRAASGQDKNSLMYNPGYMNASTGDIRPDPGNTNSWSLNGRGTHVAGNGKDVDGNNRALTTVQGVPDLGAYEFTPTSTPPNCTLLPSAFPTPNAPQYALFGGDTVAVFRWGNFTPSGLVVKQYTGTEAPGITTINPTKMFYHIDVQGTGTSLAYELDMYYKDPWLGTIASKSALRLAEKVGSNNWSAYVPAVSVSNIVRNYVRTTGVNDVGALFTGVDIGNNASADAVIDPKPPFCPGTYAVKLRIKNNGNNVLNNVKVAYQVNGGPIQYYTHSTPININGSPQGNEAIIPLGNYNFGSSAVRIKAWTYDPNGLQDPVAVDDTLDKEYFAALNGTYTVGGIAPNFATPTVANNALTSYGTCGDVVFNIRAGSYPGKLVLNNPLRVPNTSGRVTFQSENGNASGVDISHSATASGIDPTINFNSANGYTLRNITVSSNGSVGQSIALSGTSSNDSIEGCILVAPTSANSYNSCIMAYTGYVSFSGENIVVRKNKLNGGYYGYWLYPNTYKSGYVIDSNEFNTSGTGYMGMYVYNTNGVRITNNRMTSTSTNAYYGIYVYYAYSSPVITGNRLVGYNGMGMYLNYPQGSSATNRGVIKNNTVVMNPSYSGSSAVYFYYPHNSDILNNTFVYNGQGSAYGCYMYIGSSSSMNTNFYNNVVANLTGGNVYYMYWLTGYNNFMDYNNLYTTSATTFSAYQPATTSFSAWRTSTQQDANSISYNPAITSNTNPAPNVTNPAVWSLNGRGLHITGNNRDINNNVRVETRAAGVPDIGAFEVVPDIEPPLAIATPATAAPGVEQVFTFGGNEVGRIKWGNKAPAIPVEVRQYSGEKGNGIAAAAAPSGSMYFHTDIKPLATGNTFDYQVNVDYMDIWLGDIASESDLRLAHLVSGYPWMVYSGSLSSINATTNNLDAPNMNRFGSFSALENNSVASAFVRANGTTIICIGNSVQLTAEPNNGDNYTWMRNGTPIPGASGPNAKSYVANQAGDYSVEITFGSSGGNKIVESVPVTVSTIAAPNAIIGANKQLTYCAGNGLQLNAGSTPGLSYQWQLNGVDISGATSSVHPVQQAGNYTVVVTNIGCSTVSAVTPVTSGPLTVFLGNDTTYCEIPNVYAKLDAGYPGATYKWSTGETTQTIEVKQSGTYKVEVNGGPNCISTDEIVVTIDELPEANGISYVQNGNSYQFFPSGATNATGYLWIFGDGTTSNQTNPTKVITNGNVYVRLVMFNACGTDTVQLGWPLSVSKVVEGSSLQVYPNPAKDRVKVSLDGTAKLESVEILNSVGAVVYRGTVNGKEHSVDVSGLANGHYMLRATTDGGTVTRQFDIIK